MAGKLWKNLRCQKQKKALRFWAGSQGANSKQKAPERASGAHQRPQAGIGTLTGYFELDPIKRWSGALLLLVLSQCPTWRRSCGLRSPND